jgi:putative restriction endonuclease
MSDRLDEVAFRESAFAWLRARMLTRPTFTREDLSEFEFQGERIRLCDIRAGIWKPRQLSSALSIMTQYVPDGRKRDYSDEVGPDGLLRYKWRKGTDLKHPQNQSLLAAMDRGDDLIWFVGVGFKEGTETQIFMPKFPVRLIDIELDAHQFVVQDADEEIYPGKGAEASVLDIAKKYNEKIVKVRYHQPIFRTQVLQAYQQRCAVCRLPFSELLDAAHIKADSDGGAARVSNGLSLCKIHHGAFDCNIIGISPDYVIHVKKSVLATIDGPTLQHSINGLDGERLRQIPEQKGQHPDQELLAERFAIFMESAS